MKNYLRLIIICSACVSTQLYAQNVNVDSLLDASTKKESNSKHYVDGTFTGRRLIDGHTVETTQAGVLDLLVSHRFGKINDGFYNLFGLDVASMRIGADYGITNRFTIGGGRSTFEKQYDGFLKYKLLWQSEGKHSMPISLTLLSSVMYETDTTALKSEKQITTTPRTTDKFSFAYQILIARKFSDAFSLQIMPTLIHENIVYNSTSSNNLLALGAGAKIKITPHSSINLEYYYQIPGYKLPGTYNTFSIGYEIETGGHVFQLHFTNSTGMTERTVIAENHGQWSTGDIHFGFNISRVFTIKKTRSLNL